MACAGSGNEVMADWLVSKGADINAKMGSGWTAMHTAAMKAHHDVLQILLENGGNRHLTAHHREFGRSLTLDDVTIDSKVMNLLKAY